MSTSQTILGKRLHNNPETLQIEEPISKAQVCKQLHTKSTTIFSYMTLKNGQPIPLEQINALEEKYSKHHKSLWRDQTLQERQLEDAEGTIFDIIMPWVKE
jgi:hypothetical protein